jgi:hypothetical protein
MLYKSSKYTTTVASKAPKDNRDKNKEVKAFNAYLIDKYNSINQSYLK